ncbi:hypothetical protein D3C72_1718780 [compost metagenome]
MLGLAQQVDRADFAVYRVVGNDQGFGGAGEQVDADTAEQLTLGFRHEHIARADQHVHGRDAGGADGHCHHRLHAAQHQDLVRARHVHGGDDRRMGLTVEGGRRRHHALDAGDLGGQHAHVGGGQQRILATRDVAADRIDRHMAVPQEHTGAGFHLNVQHGVALDLCEVANLSLRKPDVLQLAC